MHEHFNKHETQNRVAKISPTAQTWAGSQSHNLLSQGFLTTELQKIQWLQMERIS